MIPRVQTPVSSVEDVQLRERIRMLSAETAPEEFPPVDADEDLDMAMRREAEDSFQRVLCRRTWWRLTTEERAAIRAKILGAHPEYRASADHIGLEMACLNEVRRFHDETFTVP